MSGPRARNSHQHPFVCRRSCETAQLQICRQGLHLLHRRVRSRIGVVGVGGARTASREGGRTICSWLIADQLTWAAG